MNIHIVGLIELITKSSRMKNSMQNFTYASLSDKVMHDIVSNNYRCLKMKVKLSLFTSDYAQT